MNSPENKPRMTRREFLKNAAMLTGAVALAEGATWGVIDFIEKNKRLQELEASLYFERLKNVILEIQTGKDRASELRRSIYLGNVNNFDRSKPVVSRGASTITTITSPTTTFTFDLVTGKQTTETTGKEERTIRFQFNIPEFTTDVTQNKKSAVKILYLDSGKNHPFKDGFKDSGDRIQSGVRKLLPGIDVNVVNQETVTWDSNAQVYFNNVTGDIEEDEIKNGKFRLSNRYRYLLFTEQPLKTYYGLFSRDERAGGTSALYNNIAVVNLFNYQDDSPDIITAALQEIGHSYGIDHCWENNCAMSYKFALGYNRSIVPMGYGPRCSMIGLNIANGHIEEVKDPDKPSAYFAGGRLIPPDIAKQDFERHLESFLSDIAGEIPAGIKSYANLGGDKDSMSFTANNKHLATISVKEFISSIVTSSH